MGYFLSFTLPLLIVVVAFNLLMAVYVYWNGKRSTTNIIFSILSVVVSLWLLTMYISSHSEIFAHELLWIRLSIFWATPMNALFFLLAHTFPSRSFNLKTSQLWILGFFVFAVMIVAVSPFAFTSVIYKNGVLSPVPGVGLALFGVFSVVLNILAVYFLIKKYRISSGVVRQQVSYVTWGVFIMFGLIIATIFIPVVFFIGSAWASLAPFYVFIFLVLTAIAILKYHLFNLKLIATEALVAVLTIILISEGLISGSATLIIYKIIFAIFVGIIGVLLVFSVKKEINRTKQISILASDLKKANLRLKDIDRQKTEFLSIAAHQLRTPLSILRGYTELINDGAYGAVGGDMKHVLGSMDESNERLVKLIDDFLDVSRIEQGRTKYDFIPEDLNDIISDVVEEIQERAEKKGLEVVWKKSGDIRKSLMDKEKIRHVVFNFVDNAIKYSEHGKILILFKRKGNNLVVEVKDRGLGFGRADRGNLFQKFYRGDNVKDLNVNGTGLGLYVCSKFIEAHRGKVWAKSSGLNKGSVFGFSIPYKAVS